MVAVGGVCIARTDCGPSLVARQMIIGFRKRAALQQDFFRVLIYSALGYTHPNNSSDTLTRVLKTNAKRKCYFLCVYNIKMASHKGEQRDIVISVPDCRAPPGASTLMGATSEASTCLMTQWKPQARPTQPSTAQQHVGDICVPVRRSQYDLHIRI